MHELAFGAASQQQLQGMMRSPLEVAVNKKRYSCRNNLRLRSSRRSAGLVVIIEDNQQTVLAVRDQLADQIKKMVSFDQ